jgi:hypothetical protein
MERGYISPRSRECRKVLSLGRSCGVNEVRLCDAEALQLLDVCGLSIPKHCRNAVRNYSQVVDAEEGANLFGGELARADNGARALDRCRCRTRNDPLVREVSRREIVHGDDFATSRREAQIEPMYKVVCPVRQGAHRERNRPRSPKS